MSVDIHRAHRRYGACTGFVTTPKYFDESPQQFLQVAPTVGMPWMPESLTWEPGPRDEVSWWDGGSFHENLCNSDGLKPQARTSIDILEAPKRVRDVYDELLPHYRHMHAHRLRAT